MQHRVADATHAYSAIVARASIPIQTRGDCAECPESTQIGAVIRASSNIPRERPASLAVGGDHPRSVLLVDDSRPDHFISKRLIHRNWGLDCEVVVAEDGGEAIDVLEARAAEGRSPFALIFLDVNMPRVDAWGFLELYGQLTPDAHADEIALMVTTELPAVVKRSAEASLFISFFVSKPLDFDVINAHLQRCAAPFDSRRPVRRRGL